MTTHVHDPAALAEYADPPIAATRPSTPSGRPRWLVPGVAVATVVGALVITGVLPLSIVLYAGLFGGMMLMHVGGHGHGGHGAHGTGGHSAHGGTPASDTEDLRERSSGTQSALAGSTAGLEERAAMKKTTETTDDDQHRSHSCH